VEIARDHQVARMGKDKIQITVWQGSLKIPLEQYLTRDFQTKEFLTLTEQLLHLSFFKVEIQLLL